MAAGVAEFAEIEGVREVGRDKDAILGQETTDPAVHFGSAPGLRLLDFKIPEGAVEQVHVRHPPANRRFAKEPLIDGDELGVPDDKSGEAQEGLDLNPGGQPGIVAANAEERLAKLRGTLPQPVADVFVFSGLQVFIHDAGEPNVPFCATSVGGWAPEQGFSCLVPDNLYEVV